MLKQISLTSVEQSAIRRLLLEIRHDSSNTDESVFLKRAALWASELPVRVRELFYDFKLCESSGGLHVTGNPILPTDVDATPDHHWRQGEVRPLNIAQMMHGLYSSLLGEPFGFRTQQNGRVFNDLIPVRGTIGSSSGGNGDVGFHTEDCLQPFAPDYLGFLCLRNQEQAVTTLSWLGDAEIPSDVGKVLCDSRFFCRHQNETGSSRVKYPLLFGDLKRPYLRYGSVRFEADEKVESEKAITFLTKILQRNRRVVVLNQGECLYVDNFIIVHGREAYQPRYDGYGRWFCRLVMTRDLRRTRSLRVSPESRVMLNA